MTPDLIKLRKDLDDLMFPKYSTAPTTCEVGEAYLNTGNGKLYVCSSANTWTAQT